MGAYRKSYRGIGEMLTSPFMQAEMARRAELVKAEAIATAPEDTGEYKSKFEVESGIQHRKTARAYARVMNTDDKALWLELGTGDTPRFRTLGKALGAAK